ncbi:MAG: DUF2141 domain-containing protein [Terracidiphilus sp.]|jgi:uncharacterized protein (DUF2141 family)
MKTTRHALKRLAVASMVCCTLSLSVSMLAAQTTASSSPIPAPAAAPTKSTLSIHITGFRNAKGKINIALFRDGKGFPSDPASSTASQRLEIDPQTKTATAVFTNLPQGSYAAAVFHDENLTGKMEYDSQGVPQEGYGISNNPDTTQGPPTADGAKFTVSQPQTTIEIKLVYWQ